MESKPLPPDVPKFLREFATRFENSVNGSRVILGELEGSVLEADTLRVLADAIARQEPLVRSQPHEDFTSYQREAHKTAGTMPERDRVFMASMGLAGEAGEVVDELKKVHFHAKPFDRTKLVRELGDVLWYLAELATAHGVDLQEVAFVNLAKLRARHGGEGFKPHAEQKRAMEDATPPAGAVGGQPATGGVVQAVFDLFNDPPTCDIPKRLDPPTMTVVGKCGAMQVPVGPPTAVVHGDCILSSPDASDVERGRCYVQGNRELREVHELLTRLGSGSIGSARERLFYLIERRGWRPNVASPGGKDCVSFLSEAKAPSPLEVKGTPTPPAFAASAIRDGLLDPDTVTIDGHKLVDVVNFLRHARRFVLEERSWGRAPQPPAQVVPNPVPVPVWDAFVNAAALLFPKK